ncbi:CshA/CshB family fibrillar adhesin-related protein [Erythrobacter donghaensis]|uniref:CshA/CshB family fibrillar adhesin-related protein n=1 Tax=Erythrobacter donghaensis TaxID=267135 RepID=UPI0013022376|nr:CshA/CshB family fibrillar adhesin-related protein [Erythrobacter donghaensis]
MALRMLPVRRMLAAMALLFALMWSPAAMAQNCGQAATQGTAPASWQTYCWLNLANYNDTLARTAAGQTLSFTLPDGSVLSFNARVTGTTTAYNAVTSPSWTGAAIGNTAFIGIPGRPVLYTASAGTRTITLSNITVIPPVGASATVYSFVVADAESSNQSESLRMTTNGGGWQLLDAVNPISGSAFPTISGVGTGTVTIGGQPGTVGAHILGSNSPTSVTVETQAGGLQGVMFAVRFATIRLETQIIGARVSSADQFNYRIASAITGATLNNGTTSGSGGGPFSAAPLNMSAGLPLSLALDMAPGSASPLSAYVSSLTCVNTAGATRAALPNNLAATSTAIGQLQFGEYLVCTYTVGAQPRLQVRKVLGSGGRRFSGDQFTIRIRQGQTIVASRTTTGSSGTINDGDTGLVQVTSGTSYIFDEVAAGTTSLANYDAVMACTNSASGSPTALPSAVGGAVTPRPGDVIVCTITNTRSSTAELVVEKSSVVISDPVNGTINPKLIPGAIVEYAITVRNVGASRPDSASVIITDIMPADMAFATGTPVTFTNGATTSGLSSFNAATMVGFSSNASGSGPYTYTPVGAFDAAVRAIRITPAGRMNAATSGTSQPSFTIRFRARVQ